MEDRRLIKFLDSSCSPEEEQEVLRWLKLPGSRQKFDRFLRAYFDNPKPKLEDDTDYSELLHNIHNKVLKPKSNSNKVLEITVLRALRMAASISLLIFSAYFLLEGLRYQDQVHLEETETQIRTTTRVTGPGEKLTLLMPDRTKIIVNAQSEITFSNTYGREDRVVKLKGEAYFEIAPDSLKPFKVESNGITTTALGTAFNIYAREKQYRIALTEGKVSVVTVDKGVELSPGEMAVCEPQGSNTRDISIQSFNRDKITAWKEDWLVFERKPLGEILKDLAAWYSVEMHIAEGVDKDRRLIGTYENKNLKDILTGLSFSTGFDFVIQGKTVKIIEQKPMIKT